MIEILTALIILAQTIYGEAEGENFATKLAVGQVIKNRVEAEWHGAKTFEDVCLAPFQFSCWNKGSPREEAMLKPHGKAWQDSLRAAIFVLSDIGILDSLKGIYHYTDKSIERPRWAENMELVKIGNVPKMNFWRESK